MKLAADFKVSSKPISNDEAKKFADELENCIGEILEGKRKPQNMPLEPIVALIQFVRDNAK